MYDSRSSVVCIKQCALPPRVVLEPVIRELLEDALSSEKNNLATHSLSIDLKSPLIRCISIALGLFRGGEVCFAGLQIEVGQDDRRFFPDTGRGGRCNATAHYVGISTHLKRIFGFETV